jgi:hypothetical protein
MPLKIEWPAAPPQKISFGHMREMGVRGLRVYRSDYHCSHWTAISGDQWREDVRVLDIESRFTMAVIGSRSAGVHGRTMFGYPTWSSALRAKPLAPRALIFVRISTGKEKPVKRRSRRDRKRTYAKAYIITANATAIKVTPIHTTDATSERMVRRDMAKSPFSRWTTQSDPF